MIINLTQHAATPEQIAAGVVELDDSKRKCVSALLTFTTPPTRSEMLDRADQIVSFAFASGCAQAMIGGAPFFMATLERALQNKAIAPVYAFSERKSVETVNSDGSVTKTAIFTHAGFVRAGGN